MSSLVKAHDVRSFTASKPFQSGVFLEQILSACHWKSHNTFTQFYLKDGAWADSRGLPFGTSSDCSADSQVALFEEICTHVNSVYIKISKKSAVLPLRGLFLGLNFFPYPRAGL